MEEFTFSVSDVLDYLGSGNMHAQEAEIPKMWFVRYAKGKSCMLFIPKILHDAINVELVVVCCN